MVHGLLNYSYLINYIPIHCCPLWLFYQEFYGPFDSLLFCRILQQHKSVHQFRDVWQYGFEGQGESLFQVESIELLKGIRMGEKFQISTNFD